MSITGIHDKRPTNGLVQHPIHTIDTTADYVTGRLSEDCGQASGAIRRLKSSRASLKQRLPMTVFGFERRPSTASQATASNLSRDAAKTYSALPVDLSVDHADHPAWRKRLPEFRQSKRWAKTYEAIDMSRPVTAPVTAGSHRQPSISDSALRRSMDSLPSVQRSTGSQGDSDSIQKGICGHMSFPSWHIFKQTRLNRQRSAISQSPKVLSPRRQRSNNLISSETNTSPPRPASPKTVRSRGRLGYSQTVRNLQSAIGIRWRETIPETEEPGVDEEATESKNQTPIRSIPIPAEFWNDPRYSKRWSNDCRAMLSGEKLVDFDNEWKPEPFSAEIESADLKDQPTHSSEQARLVTPVNEAVASPPVPAKSLPNKSHPAPPERVSSRGISVARAAQVKKWGRQPVVVDVKDVLGQRQYNMDSKVAKCSSKLQQQIRRMPSSATTIMSRKSNKDLKNAKSIDSMAQIEAHLQSPIKIDPNVINSRHARVMHKLNPLSGSGLSPLKNKTPAGEPPERPLPALPDIKPDTDLHDAPHLLSRASSRKHKNFADGTKTFESLRLRSSADTEEISIGSSTGHASHSFTSDRNHLSRVNTTASTWKSSRERGLDESLQLPTLKVKDLVTERSDKVHELKKKHLTATTKHQEPSVEEATADYQSDNIAVTRISAIYEVVSAPPSHPPPPLPAEPEMSDSRHSLAMSNQLTLSDDEYSVFPAPPVSRPGSCESAQNHQRSLRTGSSPRRTDSRIRLSTDQRPGSQQSKKLKSKPKQKLSQSTIMIVCDTDPSTESFRAGARSPIPSITGPGSRSPTPRGQGFRSSKGRPGSPFTHAELGNIDELADLEKPSIVKKKLSLRSLQSQSSFIKNPLSNVGRQALKYISPASNMSHAGSKHARYPLLESDSEQETKLAARAISPGLISPRTSSIRAVSKASMRSKLSRRRSKAISEESEFHVEEMMRVIARYAGKGNKFAKQMLDQPTWLIDDAVDPNRPPSAKATKSPRRSHGGYATDMSDSKVNTERRNSEKSVLTTAGTDTDDSGNTNRPNSHGDSFKMASDGSLTDPTDYDTVAEPRLSIASKELYAQQPRRSSPIFRNYETLSPPPSRSFIRDHTNEHHHHPYHLHHRTMSSSIYSTDSSTANTDIGVDTDDQLDSILRMLEVSNTRVDEVQQNRTSVMGTERLYGVVDGMKLWPDLTSGFNGSGVIIESVDGGRTLHSRYESD